MPFTVGAYADHSKNAGAPEPSFSSSEYLVTTIFYRNEADNKLQDKLQDKILSILMDNPAIKISDIAGELQISERTVYYHLKNLTESGLVVRVGARKNGYWQVKNKQ